MEEAGYDSITLTRGLDFYSRFVVPFLGPRPLESRARNWKSFMTDDFSPLEYSWSWDDTPKIRYSYEPIGTGAGTALDFFNRTRPLQCVDAMRKAVPETDWQWFDTFAQSFYDDQIGSGHAQQGPQDVSSPSAIFLAVEVGKHETMGKAYLVPVKAEQTGQTRLAVLTEAIQSAEKGSVTLPAYNILHDYVRAQEAISPFHIIGVAVDCIDPCLSRVKIYLRSQGTAFNHVCSTLSLGGRISPWPTSALEELRELWNLVLSLPSDHLDEQELESSSHETSGVLYNFDIKPNNAIPETKIYIPVKHYGRSDRAIAQGLVTFLERHSKAKHTASFLNAIDRLCSYRRLEDGCGFQTYISCAIKKGSLHITSYISPEVHHPGRWTK